MSEPQYRPPTVDEAVAFLSFPTTKRYRLRCIEYWRELVGVSFAEKVEREFRAKRKKAAGIT